MATSNVVVTDGLKVAGTPKGIAARTAVVLDHVRVTPTVRSPRRSTIAVRSTMRLRSAAQVASTYSLALRSTLKLAIRRLSGGTSARLSSGLHIHPSVRTGQATGLRSTLKLAVHTHLVASYRLSLHERMRLTGIGPGYAALLYIHDRLALHGNLARGYRAVAKLASALDLHDTLHRQLIIVISHEDTLDVHDGQVLRALYNGQLADVIDFMIDVVDPGGDTTTWAMNARTGAVTEYLNYGFAAFGQSAAGPYLGAGPDGLYELAGADDAGEPIVADLIGGLTDFGGSFLSGLKAAYLAVRGDGQFYLKLTSASGASTVYGVSASSLRTTRINMGKGHRSRFFTFELISTGQDFDLVGLNFLPIQQTRRT